MLPLRALGPGANFLLYYIPTNLSRENVYKN